MKMYYKDVTVIAPTLNEEDNIGTFLHEICKLYRGIHVIITDDGSVDKTQEIVRRIAAKSKRLLLLDRSQKEEKGLTAAVIDAVMKVETKYIVVMDADTQHPIQKVKEIVGGLRAGNVVVVACREKVLSDWALWRRITSKGATFLGDAVLMLNRMSCKDVMSGFFGIKTDVFKERILLGKKRFVGKGYKVLFDLLKQLPYGTPVKEVFYVFGTRGKGHSKMGLKHFLYFLQSLLT